jgi:hypothetical protein
MAAERKAVTWVPLVTENDETIEDEKPPHPFGVGGQYKVIAGKLSPDFGQRSLDASYAAGFARTVSFRTELLIYSAIRPGPLHPRCAEERRAKKLFWPRRKFKKLEEHLKRDRRERTRKWRRNASCKAYRFAKS